MTASVHCYWISPFRLWRPHRETRTCYSAQTEDTEAELTQQTLHTSATQLRHTGVLFEPLGWIICVYSFRDEFKIRMQLFNDDVQIQYSNEIFKVQHKRAALYYVKRQSGK